MIVRWLGQSGYILKTATTTLVIDPYLSNSVGRLAGRERMRPIPVDPRTLTADAVVCTHTHLDHLDPDTVSVMPKGTRFITTEEGCEDLRAYGHVNTQALKTGESIAVGDFTVTAVFAAHTVHAFGVVIEAEGKRLYFSGDTLFDERLFSIADYQPDIAFLCINGKLGNMRVEEAVTVAEKIGAPVNIPHHYDMFASNAEDPHKFTDHVVGGRVLEFDQDYTI